MAAAASKKVMVKLLMLNGDTYEVALDPQDTVRDLAAWIRTNMNIPIAVQHLVYGSEVLKEPAEQLMSAFKGTDAPDVTVLRRPYTAAERAELFQRLVRSTGAGDVVQVRELLKEGAPLDFCPEKAGQDVSVSLDHWGNDENAAEEEKSASAEEDKEMKDDKKPQKDEIDDEDDNSGISEPESVQSPQESDEEMAQDEVAQDVCGGLTPLFMAVATGREELARDFRQLGATEAEFTPGCELGAAWGALPPKVLEIAKHVVAGVDPNTVLHRGQGIRATESGTMLHACAANHRLPGMYELAQILIHKKADMNAGDSEGDTPLAHARYFHAPDLYKLYSGNGANVAGPFYSRWNGHGPQAALFQHLGPVIALGQRLDASDDDEE